MIIDDLTIALIVLTGVRLIGFLMFLMIYLKKGKIQHLILAVGWLIYMLGPVLDLINRQPNNVTLHPLQGLTASSGTYLLMLSIVLYYHKLSKWLILLLVSAFIIPAGIFFLFLPEHNGLFTTLVQGGFLVGILILVLFRRPGIQKSKSNLSFYWLCITLIFGVIHAIGFMMFFKGAPLSLRLAGTFIVNLSFLEFFIYLDWEHVFQSLEKSDERYRFLFETAPTALFDADLSAIPDKLIIFNANSQTLKIFEAATIDELKVNIDRLFNKETYQDLLNSMLEIPGEQRFLSLETSIRTVTGRKKDVMLNSSYSVDFFEGSRSMISIVDITEKNEIQKKMETSLHEKEILLQEVHHRVKNNLTIISSILGFQSNNSDDKQIKDIIRSIENRINTMAIVHEQLYRSWNLKKIDFSDYIKELVEGIDASFIESQKSVTVTYDMDPVYLEINILIPAGMLINEIITNSYKHAFEDIEKPEIHVELHVKQKKGLLLISDNGRGFVEKYFNQEFKTTGFIIIKAMVQQLRAELELNLKNGAKYMFSIPLSLEESDEKK